MDEETNRRIEAEWRWMITEGLAIEEEDGSYRFLTDDEIQWELDDIINTD